MEFYKCQAFVGVQSLLACQRINALLTESQVSMTQAISKIQLIDCMFFAFSPQ